MEAFNSADLLMTLSRQRRNLRAKSPAIPSVGSIDGIRDSSHVAWARASIVTMRNASNWQPTKFVRKDGRLQATSDRAELGVGSRLIANLVAQSYDRSFEQHVSGRLLDMGCGKAPLYGAYQQFAADCQCIDWGESLHGSSYLDKVCDLGGTIPYPDASFDTIILSDVLEHLPEPMNCWREMHRLLSPGGKVLLNVPFYYQVHEEPHDYYRYTEFALRRFAENSSLEVLQLDAIGGGIEVLTDLIAKLLARAGLPGARAIQFLGWQWSQSGPGKRILRRTGKRFPLGYFMILKKA
jgi:SAM-dependent methyltransferase